ncbi:GNAT family N-acetyltransferase [Arcticibacterium luteifluviistationis]|nr:GNAT family N-acetyltransferase [Arcticibacterium luteifluviistationis]
MKTKISEIAASQTWPLRHEVMWPNMPFDYIKVAGDENALHYGLWQGEELVTVVSLFIEGKDAQFRKLATRVSEQGKGLGTSILNHVLTEAKSKGIKRLWCNARVDKTKFYEKFGLVKTEQTFTKGGIDFVILERYF